MTKDEKCNDAICLGFDKKLSDNRKEWLKRYDEDRILDRKNKIVSFHDFINRELIHFSNYDLQRSIPSICDGLKPGQRKIIYSAFKEN